MHNTDQYQALLEFGLPGKEAGNLVAIAKTAKIPTNDYFIRAGEVPRKLAFVLSGLFRYVYINQQGDEFTKSIIAERNFIVSYSAMVSQRPSYFYIEALEPSELLEIDYAQWLKLKESHPFWEKFLVKLLEKGFIIKENRERELLLLDAETRYKNFLLDFPGMENRVRQHIIASYLGIKPESLSRIRKKIHPLT